MKKIYIYPNPEKEACLVAARELAEQIRISGAEVAISPCCQNSLGDLPIASAKGAQLALVLGGDGTILRCAQEVLGLDIPILGINFGHLGYMSDISPDALPGALQQILSGELFVEKRAVLSGRLLGDNGNVLSEFRAVNDISLFRGEQPGLTHTSVQINGVYIDTYHADGVLVATPNGSTAYNFSAGGPIVNPAARNMILTPICCHSLLSRSIVLAEEDRIRLSPKESGFPQLTADGIKIIPPDGTVGLEVSISDTPFLLARLSRSNFYDVLRRKMVPIYD